MSQAFVCIVIKENMFRLIKYIVLESFGNGSFDKLIHDVFTFCFNSISRDYLLNNMLCCFSRSLTGLTMRNQAFTVCFYN